MSYICTLKIKQLIDDRKQKNYEKLRSYFQFITEKLDLISLAHLGVAILIFGGFKLSNGKGMESLIHIKKRNIYLKEILIFTGFGTLLLI